jgi:hypothetical protein
MGKYFNLSKIGGSGLDGTVVEIVTARAIEATDQDIYGGDADDERESIWLRLQLQRPEAAEPWTINLRDLGHSSFMKITKGGKQLETVSEDARGQLPGVESDYGQREAILWIESVINAGLDLGEKGFAQLDGKKYVVTVSHSTYRDAEGNLKERKFDIPLVESFVEDDDAGPKAAPKKSAKKSTKKADPEPEEDEPEETETPEAGEGLFEECQLQVGEVLAATKTKTLGIQTMAARAYKKISDEAKGDMKMKDLIAYIQEDEFLDNVEFPDPWFMNTDKQPPVLEKA